MFKISILEEFLNEHTTLISSSEKNYTCKYYGSWSNFKKILKNKFPEYDITFLGGVYLESNFRISPSHEIK